MYKSNHTKSKSDTDFHGFKIINDGISKSWKIFQNNITKDLKSNKKSEKKEINKPIRKYSELKEEQEECLFISIFEKILLFKKQIDTYFFRNKLPVIKFDLDNSLQIIQKRLDDLNNKLIKECPILSKSVLIDKLTEFSEVIKILIETKPQEFYKEVKFIILSKFEKIRLEIFELLENLHENIEEDTNDLQEINKIRNKCKFNHGILFNTYVDMSDNEGENDDEIDNNLNFHLTSEVKENIISVILPRKNQILQFIEDITHDILFSLTKFSYLIDYYSLSISNLNMQLFKTIVLYVEKNRNDIGKSQYNDNKILFLIELVLILNRTFTKKSLIDFKKRINASESSIQNSMGKFILNNINELIPKCKGFDNDKKCLDKKFTESLFIKSYENFFYYKIYMKSFKNKRIELAKSFKFYYDLKLIFWKSVYTKMEENLKSPTICCRICEQNIPLNEFVLHVYYCKEQNNYYKKMNSIKSKIKKYINSLEIYKAKINQRFFNKENNFYKKNIEMNKILKIIQKEQNLFNIDKYNNNDFLHLLIKIYSNENNKSNDYYEKNPEKLSIISTLIYLTYFVYILNKKQSGIKSGNGNKSEDDELSEILGNILSYLIQILLNTEYLLEARHCRTKSNRYLNNINYSFLSSSNDIFCSSTRRYHSSKNVVFKEFKINNSQNSSMNINEEMKKRNPIRHQTFCSMMEDIKIKFSFNKALLNLSQSNNISTSVFHGHSDDDCSESAHSSNSNNEKKDKSKLKEIKSKAGLTNNFFEIRSISENRSDGVFNFFFNKSKNSETHTKDKKQINNFNNCCKTHRRIPIHKSSKFFLFEKNDNPVKLENKFFQEKKYTINNAYENPISKDFFSKDRLHSNIDSCSGSYHNSENEKDKNDTNNNNILNNINTNYSLSAKTNNTLKLNSGKKIVPSLFLKSDKMVLNYQPNLTERDASKKSLFRIQHNEEKKEGENKNFFKYSSFEKLTFEEKNNETPSEESDKDSKDKIKFEKIDKKEILRNNKKKKTIVEKKQNIKNLVLIENNDSSKDLDNKSNESKDIKINKNKVIKSQSLENKNLQLFLRNKGKNKEEKTDNSEDSSYDKDDYFNKVIIEDIDEGDKKPNEDPDKDDSLEGEFNEYKQIIENLDKDIDKNQEPEQDWFNFDSNFFMNCDINVQNQNVVNTIKELLIEINNETNGKNENDKEDNNDENELDNSKSLINLNSSQNKFSESNIKFSNFKLILPLAKGGYGTVGLYKKTKTGDLFAIKSVDINNMKEKKLSKTLQNERNILKGISSDYVVNSYFIFKDKVNYYFVMEYLPGGDVYNLLSSIILPFSTIQLIVAETLLAVYYLHSINIIHHDIKPENILITKDGHFKLSDFGLSKEINEKEIKENEENINKNSSCSNSSFIDSDIEHDDDKIEGTLFYMAPELFNNNYPIGKSIDYWAVGIVIFELFTFKVPFEAETQEKTKQNIIDYNINWDPIYSEEVSKNYKNYIDCTVDLIKKFLFFDPGKRWGDHNFKDIQNHEFFKGFDWANIKKIKNTAVLSHLKKVVEKNNNKIKELSKKKGVKNDGNLICEVDLACDESDVKFSQRIDNLQKRNNELIKMKYKKKEIKIEDDDKNFKNSLFFDLQ